MSSCKKCSNAAKKEWEKNNPERNRETARKWRIKNRERNLATKREWNKNHRESVNASIKRSMEKKPDYYKQMQRNNRRKRDYGIDNAEYDRMFVEQEGRCAICQTDVPGASRGDFCIDHCHNTGTVRGLLCFNCNVLLGTARDSIEVLEKSIAYLKESERKQKESLDIMFEEVFA
jgi:hypothetical protein